RGQGGEARLFGEERTVHRAGRTVAVFADDQLRRAARFAVRVVDLVAVDEQDQVGVLLDGAGFPQVRQQRALVAALFQGAVELGQGDHRAVELLGQGLERTGDL